MATILRLVMRTPAPRDPESRVDEADLYDLPQINLSSYRGVILALGSDQRFLKTHQNQVEGWIRAGGRLLVNGHPVLPFLDPMPRWRKLHFHGVDDIWLSALDDHPIWAGVERRDLLLRTGVPGQHSFEDLLRIGVGGFYARNYLVGIPEGGTVVTGIGPGKLAVDVSYPLGAGEVIVHAGNDLESFDYADTSAAGMRERIYKHLEQS
ncbi:MAG: hypothetical protein Q4G30_00365 [Actinomycetaceae bacterium]|nr:hypothetical protein [Actinomycetaceae bacterium]